MASNDPTIVGWRGDLQTLGSMLVDLEGDPTVELARTSSLAGDSLATWADAEAGVVLAWDTYRTMGDLLDKAEIQPTQLTTLLTTSQIPSPAGQTDPTAAMRSAKAAVEKAVAVVARFSMAWHQLAPRVAGARALADQGGDLATAKTADALAELLSTDPLAVTEADVAGVEATAEASHRRRTGAQAAAGRVDVELARARTSLAKLDTDLQAARAELDHAATRIAGLVRSQPVPDLAMLGDWLDRIEQAAVVDRARAAGDLVNWVAAADARRAELDAALAPARDGLRRREEGRGLWTALRAKAGARRLDEQADVAAALRSAEDELWSAPCDLDKAEAALARLTKVLEPPRGDRR